ncbi:glycoside hydrolase family 16 protein [Longimicrobium terrae]|uniref:Beta-glucanase (GH16 family) n=1 Tax=Longimicrobium terrae TaxID=1639882 RepID=A0A841GQS3_9BACT|nr:glycoside hydrolase family 16 protein [Longimicrobium terrae]MBB4634561.1 beta-glucanase (GH16 family) [Longimicrobium terrae]MBB6068549.1 beta-glucanase (GH16 family) [Longimicrobium terrae]NNC27737.1 glycoside hydrolase family 16 protein [Longimicrobium terrae]
MNDRGFDDDFGGVTGGDALDAARWRLDTHPLGSGSVRADNVRTGDGGVSLVLAPGARDGGELRSAERFGYGTYSARMRTPLAPGSISALFLYQGGSDESDELDIEIPNDGGRTVMFTTWVAGVQTHTATLPLAFDPAADHHEYRIEWRPGEVRFAVDGEEMQRWTDGVPHQPMYVMANAWWPRWMTRPVLHEPRALVIRRIRAES